MPPCPGLRYGIAFYPACHLGWGDLLGLAFRPSPERLRLGDPFSLGTVLSPLHSLGVWSSPVILLGLLVSENVPLRPRGVRPFLRAFSSVPLTWHPAWLQLVMGLILPHVFPCWILVSCDFWPAARSSSPWGSPPSYYHASLSSRGPFLPRLPIRLPMGFRGLRLPLPFQGVEI